MSKILVVDDEQSMRDFLHIMLKKEQYDVGLAEDGQEACRAVDEDIYDLVITDIKMPGMSGLEVLRYVKQVSPETLVLVITAFSSTEDAVSAMKQGALDYLTKPFDIEKIKLTIRNALERKQLREEHEYYKRQYDHQFDVGNIVGESQAIRHIFDMIRRIGPSKSTILVTGESGTGKELIARAIHQNSSRRDAPFVAVSCGAIPENLLESELFGYMKGAFTGAVSNKIGLFELADRGTLFLDEVGELPLLIQVKLLRVLQEKQFKRVGGTKDISVDVRIVAATNRDLDQMVAEKSFRNDLYYRLNVIPIHLPPLREREEDIPLLAQHFLKKYNQEIGRHFTHVTDEALGKLLSYAWPGNIRELENVIERAVALEAEPAIDLAGLPENIRGVIHPFASRIPAEIPPEGIDLENIVDEVEKDLLLKALEKTGWVKKHAADLLHLTFRSFRYRLDKFELDEKKPEHTE
ncbi:Fis family transcriptional regulator [candidate division KSB3 bacterium]|uniref:Fis family transcriptional regulator n=1 Tax=candidate division KSB3 bacterium TaxID=2044937 RepID=A0A2G6EAP1_9BACT|nr:MAG: Fis family transcriptional regulator [candidate division KSB3 bacterium]PIE30703.1 MAG: Fis family transcriptional regulator [candidate division KSB3 bacterium]